MRTREEVLSELKSIYGDKYDLSLVTYTRAADKITMVCPEHGPFSKSMQTHRTWKQGCRKCSHRNRYDKRVSAYRDKFISRSIAVHGNKYDYTKTIYTGAMDSVVVTCSSHGDFPLTASGHLKGQGCPFCSGYLTCDNDFKQRIYKIHGDAITTGPVEDMRHKVDARCNTCGRSWRPWPKVLLEGHGCPICNRSDRGGFDMSKPAYLYLIKFTLLNNREVFKIGITNQKIKSRINGLGVNKRATHEILGANLHTKGVDAYEEENFLKANLENYAYKGDDFCANGQTELYCIDPRLVIKGLEFAPHVTPGK